MPEKQTTLGKKPPLAQSYEDYAKPRSELQFHIKLQEHYRQSLIEAAEELNRYVSDTFSSENPFWCSPDRLKELAKKLRISAGVEP